MRKIKQKNKSDCALAAIAMAGGFSYAHVRRVWKDTTRSGLDHYDMEFLMRELGLTWRLHTPRKFITAQDWVKKFKPERAVIVVDDLCVMTGNTHAIAYGDGMLINPATGEEYDGDRPVMESYTLLDTH